MVNDFKFCSGCRRTMPVLQFHKNKTSFDGLQGYCIDCSKKWRDHNRESCRKARLKWAHRNRDKMRAKHLRRKFNLTVDEYNTALYAQGGVCAICRQPESYIARGRTLSLAVDHHHGTGKIRGLLCSLCNHGIGSFRDNVTFLKAAIDYLGRYSSDA